MAIKEIEVVDSEAISSELQALARARHPGVVNFVGACLDEPRKCKIVTEFVSGGDLLHWLKKPQNCASSEHLRVQLLHQIASTLAFLHVSCRIVHRDLKPANVLMAHGDGGVPQTKIADFGLAKICEASSKMTTYGKCCN